MDPAALSLINGHPSPLLDDLMLFASALGRAGFIWVTVATIAAVFPARRMAAWRLVVAIVVTFLVADGVIKPVVDRDRPFELRSDVRVIDQRPSSGSFPSGHTAAACAGALAAGRLFPAVRVVWWLLAGAIAFSRIYVGAHWPSDVVAGAVVGLCLAWFTLGGPAVPATPRVRLAAPPG